MSAHPLYLSGQFLGLDVPVVLLKLHRQKPLQTVFKNIENGKWRTVLWTNSWSLSHKISSVTLHFWLERTPFIVHVLIPCEKEVMFLSATGVHLWFMSYQITSNHRWSNLLSLASHLYWDISTKYFSGQKCCKKLNFHLDALWNFINRMMSFLHCLNIFIHISVSVHYW